MMKVSKSTIVRTVLLALALTNQVLAGLGYSPLPFENETVTELISLAFTAGTAIAAWWKNNSYTKAAIKADQAMHEMKQLGM